MGLFKRVRRVNGSPPPDPDDASAGTPDDESAAVAPALALAPSPAPQRQGPASATALRDGLQQLYAIRPSRDAFAEEAIKLIAKGAGVQAAALLGYETRGGRVRLLAHTGLGLDAVQTLAGDAMVGAWDIPLRALRNRRINVIESAHENPFVPRSLVAISPRRLTIAALPFFHANGPVGVIVLFSPTPRGFADGLLKALSQSLRVCAMALSELPSPSAAAAGRGGSEEAGPQPNLLRGLAALKAELARLTDALEQTERQRAAEVAERVSAQTFLKAARERSAQLDEELTALRASQERLPELEGEIQALTARLQEATQAGEAARAEIVQLQSTLAEQSRRADEHTAAIAALTERRDQLEAQLQAALESARQRGEEVATLHGQVAELAATQQELTTLREQLRRIEAERSAHEQELDAARAALGADGQALAASAQRAATRMAELEAERTRLQAELDALGTRADETRAEARRQAKTLAALQQELADHRTALADATRVRDELQARAAGLEQDAAATRSAAAQLETRLAERSAAADQLGAERIELLARIDALAAGGESLAQERQAAIAAAQRRSAEHDSEIARLAAQLEAARSSAVAELERTRHDAAATLDGLRGELAEAGRERDALQRALAAAQQECATQQRALADLAAERTGLEAAAERLNSERRELTARIETTSGDHAALQQRYEEGAARIAALEGELHDVRDRQLAHVDAQLTAERAARAAVEEELAAAETRHRDELTELRDRLAAVDDDHARLARELDEKARLLESAEHDLTAAIELSADVMDDDESVLDIDREAPTGAESAELDVLAEAESAAGGDCILLDANAIAANTVRQLAAFGHRVTPIAPTPEASDALKDHVVTCAAVNLAAPQAWSLVRHLRNGSGIPRMPLVAYALAEDAPKGFWLGPVDFAVMPVGQSHLVDLLSRLVPKIKRVIAMSNDIDVMSDVRNQLTAASISTAVVLDGRQALDLVPTIRPEAAVLHLSPSCADVFRAIAGLRSQDISRPIPIVFLLDAEAHPREDAFLTAGLRMLAGRGTLVPEGLVDSLASAFDGYR